MPRLKIRCRRCKNESFKNTLTDMTCHLKDNQNRECGGLLVRVDTHLDKRVERQEKNFIMDSQEYETNPDKKV